MGLFIDRISTVEHVRVAMRNFHVQIDRIIADHTAIGELRPAQMAFEDRLDDLRRLLGRRRRRSQGRNKKGSRGAGGQGRGQFVVKDHPGGRLMVNDRGRARSAVTAAGGWDRRRSCWDVGHRRDLQGNNEKKC